MLVRCRDVTWCAAISAVVGGTVRTLAIKITGKIYPVNIDLLSKDEVCSIIQTEIMTISLFPRNMLISAKLMTTQGIQELQRNYLVSFYNPVKFHFSNISGRQVFQGFPCLPRFRRFRRIDHAYFHIL